MAAVTICSDFGFPQNKAYHSFHCSPSICHEVMRPDAMNLVFWMLSFKATFSLSSFTVLSFHLFILHGDCSHEIKRCLLLGRKVMTNLDSILKSRHYFANKGLSNQSYSFSSSYVWMWELNYKESWAPKNWCFWIAVLEKTLESPLDCKEFRPVHPKGDQSWVFIGRPHAEAEAPINT